MNDEFIDEGFMRVCGKWLRERMQVYPIGRCAGGAYWMPDLIPEHVVHAFILRFAEELTNPGKVSLDTAKCS